MPSSSIRNFCGITKSSPTLLVRHQAKSVELIARGFSTLQARFGSTCSNAIKTVICDGGYPECSSDFSTATYKSFASGCSKLSSCPASIANFDGQSGAQVCQLSGKVFDLKKCAKYSSSSISSAYCENLPYNITFPTWLLPALPGRGLDISNLRNALSYSGASSSCITKWTRFGCLNIPFCSSDKQKILGVLTHQDCESAINW